MELLSFDLVVATVGRTDELERFLDSLECQTYSRFAVHVVDQNVDDRVAPILSAHRDLDVAHLRSDRGLSRARNAAIERLGRDIVAFPDDDCVYAPDLLERVARRFADDPALDGLSGRAADGAGRSAPSWKHDRARLTRDNVWNRAISFAIFLRRDVVLRVGAFDERLGLGSCEPWASGEEIDYLIRALDAGAAIEYDPSLTVVHDVRASEATGFRDGASVGYLLRKHRYGPRVVARMLVRPVAGSLVSLGRGDVDRARFYAASLSGRARGYVAASSSKSAR